MVFIRPRILRTEPDSMQVSGGKYNDLRQYQLDWLRTQDYNKKDKPTVLPPLQSSNLPRPFAQPAMVVTKTIVTKTNVINK